MRTCRLHHTAAGLVGLPPDQRILDAITAIKPYPTDRSTTAHTVGWRHSPRVSV
jgi:hypothetical protein